MMAGVIVTLVGLGIILVRELRVPREWMPVIVGVGLLILGYIRFLTSGKGKG
jgi:glucose uptake protein GlcU